MKSFLYRNIYGVLSVIIWLLFVWLVALNHEDLGLLLVIPNVYFIFKQQKRSQTYVEYEWRQKVN